MPLGSCPSAAPALRPQLGYDFDPARPNLVGVLDYAMHVRELTETILGPQLPRVALLFDGRPTDDFHGEIGATRTSCPSVEDVCDFGVVHERQGLQLSLETRHYLLRVHLKLADLERDTAVDGRRGLFRLISHTHSPWAGRLDVRRVGSGGRPRLGLLLGLLRSGKAPKTLFRLPGLIRNEPLRCGLAAETGGFRARLSGVRSNQAELRAPI